VGVAGGGEGEVGEGEDGAAVDDAQAVAVLGLASMETLARPSAISTI